MRAGFMSWQDLCTQMHFCHLPADRIAPASASQLALEVSKGDRVQYSPPSGGSVEATVAEVDTSHW